MLVQEVQIGKEDISVNHIIPIHDFSSDKIARLHPCCEGDKMQRMKNS